VIAFVSRPRTAGYSTTGGIDMADSGPDAGLEGITEDIKGKAKRLLVA
jgi:hypothetical protein